LNKRMPPSIPRRQAIKRIVGGAATLGLPVAGGPVASTAGAPPASAGADLIRNGEGPTYDSKLVLAASPDGATWAAWHAYHRGRDSVVVRRIGPGALGPAWTVSDEGPVHSAPVIAPVASDSAWVFWPARRADRWRLLARRFDQGVLAPAEILSEPAGDALLPAAACLKGNRILATWSDDRGGRSRIVGRVWEDGRWQPPAPISSEDHDAVRSVLAVEENGTAWVVWDGYRECQYAVWARRWLPEPGRVERVSPEGENCLLPAALGTRSGACVAWLQAQDVVGGAGAISQQYTLHAAVRSAGAWTMVRDGRGDRVAAHLDHGLVEKIEPQPIATGGYLGRRRQAMLLEDENAVWLLWERKTDHEGRTPNATGELVGRPARGGRWEDAVILHQGRLDYRVEEPARAAGGRFLLVASDLPQAYRRVYHRLTGDLRSGKPLAQEPWSGGRPIRLPTTDPIPRREIRAGGQVYRLFWGDLHCHSHLSVDVEGEPDELLAYARDKARLDVVVFTENDHMYNAWLTEAEFALGVYYAKRYTCPGRFVALPGYEWTSRLPKSPEVAVSDPRNWDPRHYGTGKGDWAKTATGMSFQNHRTVIYPPAGGPVVRHPEVGNDVRKLLEAVAAAGGLAHPHHDVWKLSGSPLEANVEVTSGWGVFIANPTYIHRALAAGHRFGLVGNSDNHRRCPGLGGGLTGIYADSLTAEGILDALRQRRVFATSGSRIVLDARADGALMGREIACPTASVTLTLSVIGTRPIVRAELLRDGRLLETFPGNGGPRLEAAHRDQGLPSGTHWYYWRVTQEGHAPNYPGNVKVAQGPLAWSSPHWVTVP